MECGCGAKAKLSQLFPEGNRGLRLDAKPRQAAFPGPVPQPAHSLQGCWDRPARHVSPGERPTSLEQYERPCPTREDQRLDRPSLERLDLPIAPGLKQGRR